MLTTITGESITLNGVTLKKNEEVKESALRQGLVAQPAVDLRKVFLSFTEDPSQVCQCMLDMQEMLW